MEAQGVTPHDPASGAGGDRPGREAGGGPPTVEVRHILTMVRWLLYLVFTVIGYQILRTIGPIFAPVLAAGAVAYLLNGPVDRMHARGMSRPLAVALLLVGFIALVAVVLFLVLPLVSREIARFVSALPVLVDSATHWLADTFGIEVPHNWQAYLEGDKFRAFLEKAVGPLSGVAATVLGGALGFLGRLAELLLVPVFAFYFLVNWHDILRHLFGFVPPRHRGPVREVTIEINKALSIWIRGQLIVMAILAVLYATAFALIGLHLAVTVGVLVGLLTIIPFLGTLVGAGLAVLMLVLGWQGPAQLLEVAAVFLVLHLTEAGFLTPRLVGKKVGLGELGALFAVLAGGQLLGFAGVLLAVPIAASIAVLARRGVAAYEHSAFFTAQAPAPGKESSSS